MGGKGGHEVFLWIFLQSNFEKGKPYKFSLMSMCLITDEPNIVVEPKAYFEVRDIISR